MKIGVRIFLGYFLVVGLAAWFLLDNAQERLKPALRQAMEDTLIDSANLLAELARDEVKAGTVGSGAFAQRVRDFAARRLAADVWGIRKDRPDYRIYVTDAAGKVLYDSANIAVGQDYSRWNDVYRTLHGHYGARTSKEDEAGGSVMHVASPVYDGGRVIGVVTVAKPSASVQPFFELALAGLAKAGVLVLAASLAIGLLLSWWLTRSLMRLADYAEAVGRGERVGLPPLGGGEVAVLGKSLEAMRAELDGKRYVVDYVHSLTHELKSPLAAIRGAAELIEPAMPVQDQARFLGNIRQELARATDIIDRLLALAQLESRQHLEQVEHLLVHALVDEVAAAKAALLKSKPLTLSLSIPPGLVVVGERFLLAQALSNLLDNAIAFAPVGSDIIVTGGPDAPGVRLTVEDCGPGVPDYARDRLFERFYSLPRPDTGRKSTGLGLPFVREVAELHGGRVTVETRPQGGACATLHLPA